MKLLISVCAVFALVSTAFADFRAGVEAYQRGNHITAFQEFWTLAHEGHAGAQFNLGVLYATGYAGPQDFTQAARWYRQAAERGQRWLNAISGCCMSMVKGFFKAMEKRFTGIAWQLSRGTPGARII